MCYIGRLFIVTCFIWYQSSFSDPIISFFLRPYPYSADEANIVAKKLKKPGKIASHMTKYLHPDQPIAGILATYGGYTQVSDSTGQIVFPRKHRNPLLYFLVTQQITPIIMFAHTIHHWSIEPGAPAQMYKVERTFDTKAHAYFWNVQKTDLPADNIIPREAIVIINKPKYIYIPTGITIANDSPDFLLPDIYVKKGINLESSAFYILNLNHFFRPVPAWYKKDKQGYIYQPGN